MSDFGFVNARLRAMRSERISSQQLDNLLGFDQLEDFSDWMASGVYGAAYGQATDQYEGLRAIDHAISEKLRNTLSRCVSMVSCEMSSPLAIYLDRIGFENVKVAVRAVLSGDGYEGAAPALVPIPPLDEGFLRRACDLEDLPSLVGMLMSVGHRAGPALRRFLNNECPDSSNPELDALDRAMERAYHRNALSQLQDDSEDAEPLYQALQDEVDLANLRTALKVAYAGGGEFPHQVLPHGRLKEAFLNKMTESSDLLGVLPWLRKTVFRKGVDDGGAEAASHNDLGGLERAMERVRLLRLARRGIEDPIGIGFTLRFLTEAQIEAQNLRLIARSSAGLIPIEAVKESMIHV
jgi:V/A-type H+-transporting ATPase subunit C